MNSSLGMVSWWLVVIGAIVWGLVGAMDFNLVNAIFGSWPSIERVVYVLVGLAGLWLVYEKFTKK
jgi:uncharacterized membrane protein YuzA (DUF378 family)